MKFRQLLLITLLVLSVATAATAADGLKVATVDLGKIAQESKSGAEAKKTLENIAEKLGKGLKKKEAELDKLKAALEGKEKQLTAKDRSAKQKEFQKKLEAYRQAAQDAQKDLRGKEEEYLNKLLTEIEKAAKEYAPKNGYALVFRKGDIIYTDGKNQVTDITDDVMKVLDSASPEAASKQEPPKK